MYIQELLTSRADDDSISVIFDDVEYSYREINKKVGELLLKLYNLAFANKNIIVYLPNSINYVIAYFAILEARHVVVPIFIKAKMLEISATLNYCESNLLITDSKNFSNIEISKLPYGVNIFIIDTLEFALKKDIQLNNTDNSFSEYDENSVALMLHTSGTTSDQKRVMLSHKNIISNIESNISSLNFKKSDKSLIVLPMSFGYCNTAQFLTHFYVGGSVYIMKNLFIPECFLQTIEKYGITNTTIVPTMLVLLLKASVRKLYNLSSLRFMCFGGGNVSIESLKNMGTKFPAINLIHTYGQTEASPRLTALLPNECLGKLGSVGKPIPNVKLKIVDEDEKEVKNNEIGEILASGNNIMKGYYKKEELTQKTIVNGWLHTGDLGYFDDEGFLYLKGRKKNLIISGGINIYPEEIEELLINIPFVTAVKVKGIEDKILGEIPVCEIVLSENNENNMKYIKDFCTQNLADYKIPKKFIIVEELERTITGKIKRN